MSNASDKVRDDFDRIARLEESDGEPLGVYDAFLVRQIPHACGDVLEIGCGTGAFSRALAARGHRVTAIDLSPEMVRVALSRADPALDITYLQGDFLRVPFDAKTYDCVVSIATLHHLPIDEAVARMADLVRPGGLLVVHDIRSDEGVGDRLRSPLAVAARIATRLRAGRIRTRASVRAAWHEHGRGERYLTMPEVEAVCRKHLRGARAVRHLQWRYTFAWRKPDAA